MTRYFIAFSTILLFLTVNPILAQESTNNNMNTIFDVSGEVYFSFMIEDRDELETLTHIISIDYVKEDLVFAYANEKEFGKFLKLGYNYTILPHPGDLLDESHLRPEGSGKEGMTAWDFYPNYDEYLAIMDGFSTNFPEICKPVFIGYSIQGREIIAVKISDNVDDEEAEPQFLYTSSIHGDELTGYVLMLNLIDTILNNYGTNARITEMVDNTEIFINPLANPDGTFWGGNNSVYGARRYNANNVDLNRNYPDPEDGPHPDGNEWQQETVAFMAFADSNHFVMGCNFHGGSEVFNYPWDTWPTLAADDFWWQYVGREYVDTVYDYSPPNYFSSFNNGISNGYQWYTISGGRQDYMNYWHSCREVTLEISDIKLIPASQLLNHWEYNRRSLLNYIEQVNYGVQGVVTDTVTGIPLQARVFIPGHDIDNSYVNTKLPSGHYSRLLFEGSYDIRYTASGYFPKTIEGVEVVSWETTPLDVQLAPFNIGQDEPLNVQLSMVYPNPSDGHIDLVLPARESDNARIECFNMKGERVFAKEINQPATTSSVKLDLGHLGSGLYLIRIVTGLHSYTDRIIIR